MPSHPNRGARTAASTPKPDEVRRFREANGLTQAQAGALVHSNGRTWARWELGPAYEGGRAMHPAFFELAKMKANAGLAPVRAARTKCTCGARINQGEFHATNCEVFT